MRVKAIELAIFILVCAWAVIALEYTEGKLDAECERQHICNL